VKSQVFHIILLCFDL